MRNGPFTERCRAQLQAMTGKPCYLTPSATAGLEIAALALGAAPGDEVIVPSYTFASTATCVVQAGLVPVLVDVRADTVNLDERLVEQAITPRTRAIFVVHYAGVSAEMDTLLDIARRYGLAVVEDAAQGCMPPIAVARWALSATWGCSASTRRRILPAARAAPWSSAIPVTRPPSRSTTRWARTAAAGCGERLTSTAGWTAARTI